MNTYSFVLLRGLAREAAHWGPFLSILRETFPGSRVECLDLPGTGRHFRRRGPTSIDGIVAAMRPDLLRLKLDQNQPRVLVAVSLGAMVASCWFKDHPLDFTHGVLINTSFKAIGGAHERLRPTALKGFFQALAQQGAAREKKILEVVSNRPDRYNEVSRLWGDVREARPISATNILRQLWAAAKFEGSLTPPALPIMLLGSAQDRMVNPVCSERLARAWRAPLMRHPTAGHDLTTDEPSWAAQAIRDWLASR